MLEELTESQRAVAHMLMAKPQNKGRHLGALQAVAQGYRAAGRMVRIREDRSIRLWPWLGQERKSHDSLRERLKSLKRSLRGNPLNVSARSEYGRLQDELNARLAGKPTKGFKV